MPMTTPQAEVGPSGLAGVEAYNRDQEAQATLGLGYANLAQRQAQDQQQNQLAQAQRADAMQRFLGQQENAKGDLANRNAALAQQGQYQQGELANRNAALAEQGKYHQGELDARTADLQFRTHDVIERQTQDNVKQINQYYDKQIEAMQGDPHGVAALEQERDQRLQTARAAGFTRHAMAGKGQPWAQPDQQGQPEQPQAQAATMPISLPESAAVPASTGGGGVGSGPTPGQPAPSAPELSLTAPQNEVQAGYARVQARKKKESGVAALQKQLTEGIPKEYWNTPEFMGVQQQLNNIASDPTLSLSDAQGIMQSDEFQKLKSLADGKQQFEAKAKLQEQLKNAPTLAAREKLIDDADKAFNFGRTLPDAKGQTENHADLLKNQLPENKEADRIVARAYSPEKATSPLAVEQHLDYQQAKAAHDITQLHDPNNPEFLADMRNIIQQTARTMISDATRKGETTTNATGEHGSAGFGGSKNTSAALETVAGVLTENPVALAQGLSNFINLGASASQSKSDSSGTSHVQRQIIGNALKAWQDEQKSEQAANSKVQDWGGVQDKLNDAYASAKQEREWFARNGGASQPSSQDQAPETPQPSPQSPTGPTPLGNATQDALNTPSGDRPLDNPLTQRFEQVSSQVGGSGAGFTFAPQVRGQDPGMAGRAIFAPPGNDLGEGAKVALRNEQLELWNKMNPSEQAFYAKRGFSPLAGTLSNFAANASSKDTGKVVKGGLIDAGKAAPYVLSAIPGGGIVAGALANAGADALEGKKSGSEVASEATMAIAGGKIIGKIAEVGVPALVKAFPALGDEVGVTAKKLFGYIADNHPDMPAAYTPMVVDFMKQGMALPEASARVAAATEVLPKGASMESLQLAASKGVGLDVTALRAADAARPIENASGTTMNMNSAPAKGVPWTDLDASPAQMANAGFSPSEMNEAMNPGGETFNNLTDQAAPVKPPTPEASVQAEAQPAPRTLKENEAHPSQLTRFGKLVNKPGIVMNPANPAPTVSQVLKPHEVPVAEVAHTITPEATAARIAADPDIPPGPVSKEQYVEQATKVPRDLYGKDKSGLGSKKIDALTKAAEAQFDAQHSQQVASSVSQRTGVKVSVEDVDAAKSLKASMDKGGPGDVQSASAHPSAVQQAIEKAIADPKLDLGPTVSTVQRMTQTGPRPAFKGQERSAWPDVPSVNRSSFSGLTQEQQAMLLALENKKRAALAPAAQGSFGHPPPGVAFQRMR